MKQPQSNMVCLTHTPSTMGKRLRHRQLSDVDHYVIIKNLVHSIFSLLLAEQSRVTLRLAAYRQSVRLVENPLRLTTSNSFSN
jgi:hypothetical protein